MRQCTEFRGSYFCNATRKTKSRSASGALRSGLRLNMREHVPLIRLRRRDLFFITRHV